MKKSNHPAHSFNSSAVFDMSNNTCVWSKAGVIHATPCINAFDCLNCPLHKKLKRDVAEGRLKDGRVPLDWRIAPDHRPPQAGQQKCRHMLSGLVASRQCINNYHCESCAFNQMLEDEVFTDFQNHSQQKIVSGFAIAENYYYHTGHAWARVEYGGFVRVGLDDFGARVFGPFERIALPELGSAVQQGEPYCSLVRGNLRAECLSPVEGVVVAVNPKASADGQFPEWEPYDAGWLMVIEPVRLNSRLRKLFSNEDCRKWMEDEASRLAAMIDAECGFRLAATGGRAIPDIYGQLPELGWERLKTAFLHT
jgi:glycine cleavage system H lipoate-binding protein